jgi:arylsulfatase A-like enzyme
MLLIGGLQTELDQGLALGDFEAVQIRARSSAQFAGVTVAYNVDDEGAIPTDMQFFFSTDEAPPVFSDGSEQTYSIPLRPREGEAQDAALESLAIVAATVSPAALDILSIELVPRGAAFLDDSGVRHVSRSGETRNTLFAHTPAAISFALRVPSEGRFDVGLSTSPGETVAYRLTAREGGVEPIVLLAETIDDSDAWQQRSVDLATFAGRSVELALEAESPTPGKIALWGAPVVSGRDHSPRPNVIFYVIDGGGADLMSAYGYARRTTPFLEELAHEGVVFDRAFSNATWTQPSTASFMTSLHHSVLGGLRRGVHSTPIPSAATPMAVHMRRGGYQTASFSANPNSGRIIGVERGVDVLRDGATPHHSTSSVELHEQFWRWREDYPGSPYWVHFQTTDVHEPNEPVEPFAGLFVTPEERARLQQWDQQIFNTAGQLFGRTSIIQFYDLALEQTGIPRQAYFGTRRGLYDETMTHQDRQLRDLVNKLKASGEWENTLLVIGADHGHPAGSFARWGRGLFEPQPEPWEGALFDAYASRVPLIFVWPGHIPAGRRFSEPVSMIDVLPTILDLVDLPQPEVLQGQSLAPLLITGEQELRPVVFDEFRVENDTGAMIGNLDIVDGRWGASLEIGPPVEGADPDRGRHAVPIGGRWGAVHPYFPEAPRLLLYDLESDPFARAAVNDEHPDLVAKYQAQLLDLWQAHQALAGRFKDAGEIILSPEQLRQLRALGYIQ